MSGDRVHRATSTDGTGIVGTVHGNGPAIVLVHGALPDGDGAWVDLVPLLQDRFTCFLPSLRGRGLSEDSPDHSPGRQQEDVRSFVDSIGERVFLVAWSAGVPWSFTAVGSASVRRAAFFEPTLIPLIEGEDEVARDAMYAGFAEAVLAGRPSDAARAFHEFVCNERELAAIDALHYERWADSVPALLAASRQAATGEGRPAVGSDVLRDVIAPVLMLRGRETRLTKFYADTERHIAERLTDVQVAPPLAGLGHLGPLLEPVPIAAALREFFGGER